MADKRLTKLIKAAGTREQFVECYNGVIDEIGDEVITRLTLRACNYWTADAYPPAHAPIWILASVLRMGMTAEAAIELYPDLEPALELARLVANLAEQRQADARAA